jgi:5-methylcytosine-specific restriction endonuclease McrA
MNLTPTPAPWAPAQGRTANQGRVHKEKRYYTARWRRLRAAILRADPICQGHECDQLATVCDHIHPARIGGAFWDPGNLQGLCTRCHNVKSSAESRGQIKQTTHTSP